MLRKTTLLLLIVTLLTPSFLKADEGMWLPILLNKREADMKKNGMKISAEDIYSVNQSSLKDAIMIFGRGCTGEFVSPQGLLLTNHHCGYSNIVSLSTVERDYLTNGFWAYNMEEELPCPGLSITQLIYMEDVTHRVLEEVSPKMSEKERNKLIEKNIKEIVEMATKDNHYEAEVKPFYYGNQYFLYVNEVFNDIRLVGAPPSNIGKFGGDTDNWMWPRHTGDFSMFRVYANKDNKPAKYSKDNIPYTPKQHLKINIKGVEEGDFTFVFGYPGRTQQYLSSHAVDQIANFENPTRIKLRDERLKIYKHAMEQSPSQRLRYSAPVAGIANGWKKWIGETNGIKRLNVVDNKKEFEREFDIWANTTEARKEEYSGIINGFKQTYEIKAKHEMPYIYLSEAVLASDFMKNAREILSLSTLKAKNDEKNFNIRAEASKKKFSTYFNNDFLNHSIVDKEIFIKTMSIFYEDYAKANNPWLREKVEKKHKGNPNKYFEEIYNKSILSDEKKTMKLLSKFSEKKALKDPAIEIFSYIFNDVLDNNIPVLSEIDTKLDSLYRIYVKGQMEMMSNKEFYPDANFTLRVAYGNIEPYYPRDGVKYETYTTIEGIMEKENPEIYDYVVVPKLKELYLKKDYGQYKNAKGELPVAFIASNHTTGGNSGSPVLNANGELIGINFDRCWEGTMSDIAYDVTQCRNISIDIRYLLFIVDKLAGAENLIKEMTIIK
ncbi:MAG: S46 family peptidase [Bacteroidales bacterium]|nr:S46 family peptidase [Bacteroidales bacterium]